MNTGMVYGAAALASLLPAVVLRFRVRDSRDSAFWLTMALAVAGPAAWVAGQLDSGWHTGFATSLALTIAVTTLLFSGLAVTTRQGWRLTPLLMPYLAGLGILALIWQRAPERAIDRTVPAAWFDVHVVLALLTYGLLTLAAVAGTAVFLQERALKAKHPTGLTRRLPAVAESENLQISLLAVSELVLAFGLASGMAAEYFERGRWLIFDHKTALSLAAFVAIGLLLVVHRFTGVRGRQAARGVLAAYLLLTLAYPGVKFVTDVLMS